MKPLGPHRLAKDLGSTEALKTRSGDALSRRVILSVAERLARLARIRMPPRASRDTVGVSGGFSQNGVEARQAFVPEAAVLFEPAQGGDDRRRIETAAMRSSRALASQEARCLEHPKVFRDRRPRHRERRRERADIGLALRQPRDDRPPCRIGERAEYAVKRPLISNHMVKYRTDGRARQSRFVQTRRRLRVAMDFSPSAR